MTFKEIYEKYNLTEKEVHTLKMMKDCDLEKNLSETGFNFTRWKNLVSDGILIRVSYNPLGIFYYKLAEHVHE